MGWALLVGVMSQGFQSLKGPWNVRVREALDGPEVEATGRAAWRPLEASGLDKALPVFGGVTETVESVSEGNQPRYRASHLAGHETCCAAKGVRSRSICAVFPDGSVIACHPFGVVTLRYSGAT